MPFISKTKGRMSMLLKKKSKIVVKKKERVTYPVYNFAEKRVRDVSASSSSARHEESKKPARSTSAKPKVVKPTVVEKYDEPMEKK